VKTFEHVHSLRQYNNVTDGQTDVQTEMSKQYRVLHATACCRGISL